MAHIVGNEIENYTSVSDQLWQKLSPPDSFSTPWVKWVTGLSLSSNDRESTLQMTLIGNFVW